MPPKTGTAPAEHAVAERAMDDLAAEAQRLREQVATLQADAEARDKAETGVTPAYENPKAGTGPLAERLARVMGHTSRIPKRGYNEAQKYPFVAHSDVLDAIRPALAAEGVQFRSKITKTEATPETNGAGAIRQTGQGVVWCMWRIEVEFRFVCWNADKLCEQVTEDWPGFAQDYSDKGASKALTAAVKTFLIQQFLLSTGDDPDNSTVETGAGQAQQQQRSARPSGAAGGDGAANDVRVARRAVMDFNEKLPKGVLSKIAKRVTGQGMVMKVDDVAQLGKIARAAERYLGHAEGSPERAQADAWLAGDATHQPDPQAAAEAPDAPVVAPGEAPDVPPTPGQPTKADAEQSDNAGAPSGPPGDESNPLDPEPVTPTGHWHQPIESYDPPLNADELRQHDLGLNPRPPKVADDDDIPF